MVRWSPAHLLQPRPGRNFASPRWIICALDRARHSCIVLANEVEGTSAKLVVNRACQRGAVSLWYVNSKTSIMVFLLALEASALGKAVVVGDSRHTLCCVHADVCTTGQEDAA